MALTKEQKKYTRKLMATIMSDDNWMENPEAVEHVQALSQSIGSDLLHDSKPLPRLDPERMTRNNYLYLVQLGYLRKDIKRALGLGSTLWDRFIADRNVSSRVVSQIEIDRMIFTEQDKKLPILEESDD